MLWVNKTIADDTNKEAVVCNHICTRNAINVPPVTIRTEKNWIIPASLSEFTLIWWMHVQNPPGWCALLWMCCSSIICLFEATQKSQENVLPIVDSLSQQGKAWLKCLGHFFAILKSYAVLGSQKVSQALEHSVPPIWKCSSDNGWRHPGTSRDVSMILKKSADQKHIVWGVDAIMSLHIGQSWFYDS